MSQQTAVDQKIHLLDEMMSLLAIVGVNFEHKDHLLADRTLDEDEM